MSNPLNDLTTRWREEATVLRRRGAELQAEVLEGCAAELETATKEHELEALTLQEAADASGYSYSALQKMVTRGELANVGDRHRPRVRRGDLPRKARGFQQPAPNLAAVILGARK